MIYYLTHYDQKTYPFLIEYLNRNGFSASWMHTPVSHGEYVNAFIGAWNAVRKAQKGDTIITYMSSTGMLCWWISWLLHKQIHIIATNLALKDDSSLQTKLMVLLYRGALKSNRFTLTVTSKQYGETMRKRLHTQRELPLLRDYGHFPGYAHEYKNLGKRIFCGGNTQRDWASCISLAKFMTDWRFLLVGWKNEEGLEIPKNVKRIERLPFQQFMQAMRNSTVVYVPVKWNCPAGLIVMMEAAWEGKLVATSHNDITTEYISAERGIAENNIEEVAQQIDRLYEKPEECATRVKALQIFLLDNCSAEVYSNTITNLITL